MRNPARLRLRSYDPAPAPPGWCLRCVARCQARPGERYERPAHDHHTIEAVEAGYGLVRVGDEEQRVGPGDAYLLPLGRGHCIVADQQRPWRKLFLNCTGPLLDQLRSAYGLGERCIFPGAAAAVARPLRELLDHAGDDGALQLRTGQVLVELVAALHASTADHPSWPEAVRRAKAFIDANLERPIQLAEIATHAGCSEAHLSRRFRASIGQPPGSYLLGRRMELAKALLDTTAEPIKRIADRLCYRDSFAFSHAFKTAVGCAPTEWRNGERPASRDG